MSRKLNAVISVACGFQLSHRLTQLWILLFHMLTEHIHLHTTSFSFSF